MPWRPRPACKMPPRRTIFGVSDDLFSSGPWTGFYNYQPRDRHRMDLDLAFAEGSIRGEGNDDVGRFLISGRYDCANLECWWTKTYPGSHDVHYRGFREGKGIWGTWEIGLHSRGGFHIWPKGAAGGDLESRVVLESEPVEAVGRELVPSGPQKEEGGLWLYTQRLFSTKTRQFFSREKNILKLFRRSQHRPELRFNPAINFHAVQ